MIDEKFIEDLRSRVNIVDVINAVVPLKKAGKDYKACCPFHEEKTPSFTVSESKQHFNCFGCGSGGNVFDFVADYQRLSFPEAVKYVAGLVNVQVIYQDNANFKPNKRITVLKAAMNSALSVFTATLIKNKDACLYARSRGIKGSDIEKFGIGFADNSWSTIKKGLAGQYTTDVLVDAGLVISKPEENKEYDFFNNRLMFPVRDEKGDVIAFGARRFDGQTNYKYINSPETEIFKKSTVLYGLYESIASPGVNAIKGVYSVVEGYMDVVASHRFGFSNTVAPMGTSFTDEQAKKLFHRCDEICFSQDGDKAGLSAIVRSLTACAPYLNAQKTCSVVLMPAGEDPDSYLNKYGADSYKNLINSRIPASEFLIKHYFEVNKGTLEGKASAISAINDFINLLKDEGLKQVFNLELQKKIGVAPIENPVKKASDYYAKIPGQYQSILNGIPSDIKVLAGMYLTEPNWTKLLPLNEDLKNLVTKESADILSFALNNKPTSEAGHAIVGYLKSNVPDLSHQIDIVSKYKQMTLNNQMLLDQAEEPDVTHSATQDN